VPSSDGRVKVTPANFEEQFRAELIAAMNEPWPGKKLITYQSYKEQGFSTFQVFVREQLRASVSRSEIGRAQVAENIITRLCGRPYTPQQRKKEPTPIEELVDKDVWHASIRQQAKELGMIDPKEGIKK